MKVLVTGAGGKTGTIVVRKLLERGTSVFQPRALVRSTESGDALKSGLGELGKDLEVVLGDVSKPETLQAALEDVEAVVIVTSAVPKLDKLSLVGVIATKLVSLGMASRKPSFWFAEGGSPEEVDWVGQRNQVDAAKAAGVKHVVLVSSMAGTKPDHFLNTNMNNIVLWKRRAECYLVASGVPYTIIHPGGLLPHFGDKNPAPGGKRQLYVGVDDELMGEGKPHSLVPREDVAEVCVLSLLQPAVAAGRSFDLGSGPEGEGTPFTDDLQGLLANLGGKNTAYTEADANFSGPAQG